jgi:tetratricopeptide (TPR) repeat protein
MTHPSSRSFAFSAILFCALIPQPAQASDDAAQLFKDGRAAMAAEDYATAAEKLKKSYDIDPSPGTLLNLAICEEKLGRLVLARKHIGRVLESLHKDDPRRPIAEEQARTIRAKLPRLTIRLSARYAPTDVVVDINNTILRPEQIGMSLPVNPGTHTVVFSSPQGLETHVIRIAAGERKEFTFNPHRSAISTRTADDESTSSDGPSVVGIAFLGVGIVGVAAGSYLWYDLGKKQDTIDEACNDAKYCTGSGLAAAEDGRALMPLYIGSWIVGAVGLGTGTYFLLNQEQPSEPVPRVTASPLPGGGTLDLSGRF